MEYDSTLSEAEAQIGSASKNNTLLISLIIVAVVIVIAGFMAMNSGMFDAPPPVPTLQ